MFLHCMFKFVGKRFVKNQNMAKIKFKNVFWLITYTTTFP